MQKICDIPSQPIKVGPRSYSLSSQLLGRINRKIVIQASPGYKYETLFKKIPTAKRLKWGGLRGRAPAWQVQGPVQTPVSEGEEKKHPV
jgi:hypothetical protein